MKPLARLNILQFFAAINENFLRALITYFILSLNPTGETAGVLSKTQSLFLFPFLLFSNLGGSFADKFSKQKIIQITRYVEFGLVCLCLPFILFLKAWPLLILLFLVATTSSIFSPSKYSILTEIHPRKYLLEANSTIASFTFLGIILGTGLTSAILQAFGGHFIYPLYIAIVLAIVQIVISYFIPVTEPAFPKKVINPFIYREFIDSVIEMSQIPKLFPTFIAYGYFLFLGSFIQLGIMDYTITQLGKTPVIGGYYFLLCSIGTVVGSYLAKLIKQAENKLLSIPIAGFFLSLFFLMIGSFPAYSMNLGILLIFIGVGGGLMLVPAQTFILEASPNHSRGRNFGSANVLSFLFALLAPLLLYFMNQLGGLSIRVTFIFVSLFNALVMLYFYRSFKNR